ncbi:armadillo-type protein [Lineolata rhizophorae]|uniref:Armadillo-type protein n=1 Tax=Lineolata rhizophorae TaxID=578093 RepID=A0A6A6NXC3_9PEZI|nr:armadillo-type protein [Lineolata rhizophorae]
MDRKRKRELRALNAKAWAGESDIFPVQSSLDSSMKKNTAFIKRLRTAITPASQATFLTEVRTLSLVKYLSEIISACYEGLCKLRTSSEIAAGIEVISALHQRFGPHDFTGYLAWHVGKGLATPDKAHLKQLAQDVREREEKERLARQRVLLRVATELWLVSVLRTLDDVNRPEEAVAKAKEGPKLGDGSGKSRAATSHARFSAADGNDAEPFPLEVLKDMLGYDREHINLPLVVIFVKTFAWDILGVKLVSDSRKTAGEEGKAAGDDDGNIRTTSKNDTKGEEQVTTDDDDAKASTDPPITSPELRQRFRSVLMRYFEDVKSHLIRDQKALAAQSKRNAEAYVKSGEVFEDRQTNYERQAKVQDKFVSNAQVLADAVGAEMPDLKEKDNANAAGNGSIGLIKAGEYLRGQGEGPGIWEDEEERRFYENLIDLKDRVPGILLEDGRKKKPENDDQVGKKVEPKAEFDSKDKAPPTGAPSGQSDAGSSADLDDQSTAIANKSVGAQVDALLAQLPEMTTKDAADEKAMEFCFLNSKASRNRLIKAVQDIPKGRTDLLPLYSRLVATLAKYMPDVSQGLVSYLDDEFRSLQRRKQKDFLGQVRLFNVRYLAELTKFGVVPEHVIFHCLKVSLDDFSRMNIEIICNLLENCGRYLLRNPETNPRMASFLETLQRKKSAQHLGQQERMLLENAMYYVNPPERAAIEQKERTPLELFLRQLIYVDLTKRSLDKVVKQIRKLHWEEPEVVHALEKIFTKPGKIKYSHIHLLAVMMSSLNRYHLDFVIMIIDDLLEYITLGLELNDFKYNQRRIAEIKYLGELYIYRLVDSPVIFDTLYRIITYGHEGGIPKPGVINPLDLPDDFFRIRLACNILETCGTFFNKGASKRKFDFFLTFFQYYIFTKEPMPMDIEFIVQDAYALTRPDWKLALTLEEAGAAFADAVHQNYQTANAAMSRSAANEPEDQDEDSVDEGDGAEEDQALAPRTEADEDHSSGEEVEGNVNDADELAKSGAASESSSDEEERIVVTRPEDDRDPEAEAEFDRELAKLMAESMEGRKFDRKPVFDVPLPMRKAPAPSAAAGSGDDEGNEGAQSQTQQPADTMKFSLLSRKGNKQQTRSIDLPSDSNFAIAMRNQQEAAKAEQQRIKSLVLNYDLRDDGDADGSTNSPFQPPLQTNPNHQDGRQCQTRGSNRSDADASAGGKGGFGYGGGSICNDFSGRNMISGMQAKTSRASPTASAASKTHAVAASVTRDNNAGALEKANPAMNPYTSPARFDKAGSASRNQRARKLQLSDVDWYEDKKLPSSLAESSNTGTTDAAQSTRGGGNGDSRGGRGGRGRGGNFNKGRGSGGRGSSRGPHY